MSEHEDAIDLAWLVQEHRAAAKDGRSAQEIRLHLLTAKALLSLSAERDRLRHENDCLQAQVQQKDYPCSPHCEGYLRELQLRRAALGEKADV